jgi:enediyne biosynthesis protein E4
MLKIKLTILLVMKYLRWHMVLLIVFIYSCENKENEPQLFEVVPSKHSNIKFSNFIYTDDSLNALNFDYIYNGGGVAVGDINNDGLMDLYFTGNMVSSKLYLNKGNFIFEDITEKANVGTSLWATGVSMVDINADGFLDIYVCIASRDTTLSANQLFINNGNNTFTERAKEYGLADKGYSTHAAFFDYDKDGDLDMYLLTNGYETTSRNNARPKMINGEAITTDRLYRNNGDNTFTNVSREAGIIIEGYGLGVGIADINQDGWPDVYVANDFLTNDLMWINNGDGTFTDKAGEYLKHQSHNGMGIDIADYNNDGLLDIVVLDMLPEDNLRQKSMFSNISYNRFVMDLSYNYTPQYIRNTLQLNNGNGTFSEIGQLAGIHATDWSWSALFADYDNDGFKDLLITNGYRKDVTDLDYIVYRAENAIFGTVEANHQESVKQLEELKGAFKHNYMFKNRGDFSFKDVSKAWGLGDLTYSNGAAFVDLDNDGDLDLVINNIDAAALLYRNNSDKLIQNSYLQIKLEGTKNNKTGFGSKITLYQKEGIQYHEHSIYRGYKSTVDDIVHFGLAKNHKVDSIKVEWPDGKVQLLIDVKSNQRISLHHKDATEISRTQNNSLIPIFTDFNGKDIISLKHIQQDFSDFNLQRLIPHKYSSNGPGMAVGDITGNGLDDIYISGSAGVGGKLFLQISEGKFEERTFLENIEADEMGALFFDADGDGDLDLYVVSGGSRNHENPQLFQDKLYINDGKGNFSVDFKALPEIRSSGSCVVAADYDKDGFFDLFIGGRIVPGSYPLPAKSYVLRNNRGKFEDVTEKVFPGLHEIGLVTSAIWTDIDNDNKIDLIVVGEWMPVTIYKNNGKEFKNITSDAGLKNSTGWWNSISAGDFDEDGNTDYILGNLGLNTKYKASKDYPVRVYAGDFDENGSIDPIISHYIDGLEYPVHPRDNLIDQIAGMKKRFIRYSKYGKATMNKVLTKDELKNALILKSEYFQSALLRNKGNGKFILEPLPVQAQFAPVYGSIVKDFDEDGHLDVLLCGNSYAPEVLSGWYDAGIGTYLKGKGNGSFTAIHNIESGFFADKDAKAMTEVNIGNGGSIILVSNNNDNLKVFKSAFSNQKIIKLNRDDHYALIINKGGKISKREFYYGSGYLSQLSRTFTVDDQIESLEIFDYKGNSRKVFLH